MATFDVNTYFGTFEIEAGTRSEVWETIKGKMR